MSRSRLIPAVCGVALVFAASNAAGQGLPVQLTSPIARAERLAAAGDSARGRVLLDSVLAAGGSPASMKADALYLRARLASSENERERGLAKLITDYPFSPRASVAQFELAVLEESHADRDRAAVHFTRFLAEVPSDSNRIAASLALGRILTERGELPRACAVLLRGREEVPESAVELRNRFAFATTPCAGVDTNVVLPPVDTTATIPKATPPKIGEWTVQVAAYDKKDQADRLATKLRGQGLEARVIETGKLFKVRVGHYATSAIADAESKRIDALIKSKTFVVRIGAEEK